MALIGMKYLLGFADRVFPAANLFVSLLFLFICFYEYDHSILLFRLDVTHFVWINEPAE